MKSFCPMLQPLAWYECCGLVSLPRSYLFKFWRELYLNTYILYVVYCILLIEYCELYIVWSYCLLHPVYCILYILFSILFIVQCTLYIAYYIRHIVYCILYFTQDTSDLATLELWWFRDEVTYYILCNTYDLRDEITI